MSQHFMNIKQMIEVCPRVILACVAATAIDNGWCVFPVQQKNMRLSLSQYTMYVFHLETCFITNEW